jgi:hypothetical protein
MKRELALQLLQTIIPTLADEGSAAQLFREMQVLADYKYNKYEMYHPGRLFLENLYLWLQQFTEAERADALAFVREQLIFVSREEFQQLAHLLYHDRIRRQQFASAADYGGIPRHQVRRIRESASFQRTSRASLYVGMSDGARLDFIRRHNLDLNNEQFLPYYAAADDKVTDCVRALRTETSDANALFRCLFLIDDFAGSGSTLLREVVSANLPAAWTPPNVPQRWYARLRFSTGETHTMEVLYRGALSGDELAELRSLDHSEEYQAAVKSIAERCQTRDTKLKGSLRNVSEGPIAKVLEPDAQVFFCPLLTTQHALDRLTQLIPRLTGVFAQATVLPAAVIDARCAIVGASSPIGKLCEHYYDETLEDKHTGNVKFGYDGCGLPLVLHHNTPNNSLYLLWARRSEKVAPLFVRYERHGREGV